MKKKKGFTLIELLVVIAVIGLLSSIVLVSLGPARDKARDAKRKSDISQINLAMEMCYDDSSCGGSERYLTVTAGTNTVTTISNYLNPIPEDPSGATIGYEWTANDTAPVQQYYCVWARMQAEDNTYICASNKGVFSTTTATGEPTNTNCCGMNVTN